MKEDVEDMDFHMVRTNNGEYVSERYAVFKSKVQAKLLEASAVRLNVSLEKHILADGSVWFFKHELEALQEMRKVDIDKLDLYLKNMTLEETKDHMIINPTSTSIFCYIAVR